MLRRRAVIIQPPPLPIISWPIRPALVYIVPLCLPSWRHQQMNCSYPFWKHYKKNTNQNYVSKSNPILCCFLITFSNHQKKTSLTALTLLTYIFFLSFFFFQMFSFSSPGFSFGYNPMLISSSINSFVSDNSLKISDRKKGPLFKDFYLFL